MQRKWGLFSSCFWWTYYFSRSSAPVAHPTWQHCPTLGIWSQSASVHTATLPTCLPRIRTPVACEHQSLDEGFVECHLCLRNLQELEDNCSLPHQQRVMGAITPVLLGFSRGWSKGLFVVRQELGWRRKHYVLKRGNELLHFYIEELLGFVGLELHSIIKEVWTNSSMC